MLEIHARIHCDESNAHNDKKLKYRCAYVINKMLFTLDDIEHGVLRGNRRRPYTLSARFADSDARAALSMAVVDARLHFALNCGAKSCPPVRIFTAANLDSSLDRAAKWFCNEPTNVAIDKATTNSVTLSQIFHWYSGDFGTSNLDSKHKPTLLFIARFITDAQLKLDLQSMLDSGDYKIKWFDYNWDVNEVASE